MGRDVDRPLLPSRVPEVVRTLARWAVLSSMGGAAGCAAGDDRGGLWEALRCAELGQPGLLQPSHARGTLDYLGIFEQTRFSPQSAIVAPSSWVVEEDGTQCSSAEDRTACGAAFDAAKVPSDACAEAGDCNRFLITTEGDQVTRGEGRSALLDLIVPIDDRYEALLVANFDGYSIPCTAEGMGTLTREVGDGFEIVADYEECGAGVFHQVVRVDASGELEDRGKSKTGESGCAVGRRPVGLRAVAPMQSGRGVGALLADGARLEAASVYAFVRLACELAALDAPPALIATAVRSAHDEVGHAAAMSALALRFGVTPVAPVVAEMPLRSAEAIALENAVEGCVRETYGALLAHHQAACATDSGVRAALHVIAEDETCHAQLAWAVAEWLEPRLSTETRVLLVEARRSALAQLLCEVDSGLSRAERELIGWPAPELAVRMIGGLGEALGLG